MGEHLIIHGDGVKDIAFEVEDLQAIFKVSLCGRHCLCIRLTTTAWDLGFFCFLLESCCQGGSSCEGTVGGVWWGWHHQDGSDQDLWRYHTHSDWPVRIQRLVPAWLPSFNISRSTYCTVVSDHVIVKPVHIFLSPAYALSQQTAACLFVAAFKKDVHMASYHFRALKIIITKNSWSIRK